MNHFNTGGKILQNKRGASGKYWQQALPVRPRW